MFLVSFFNIDSQQTLIYGPFTTEQLANAWVAGRATPRQYKVIPVYSTPPNGQYGPVTPGNVQTGNIVVLRFDVDANDSGFVWAYGPWSSFEQAGVWLASLNPGFLSVTATVRTPPS